MKLMDVLSSSVKKPDKEAKSQLHRLADKQTSKDFYHIMPRWKGNVQGEKLYDLKARMAGAGGPSTIYFKDYEYIPDRGTTTCAVSMIRETFEKRREYLDRTHASISSVSRLATNLRVTQLIPIK